MHHKHTNSCNGRTQVFNWYSATPLDGAPPQKFCCNRFWIKPKKVLWKIEIMKILKKLDFLDNLPKIGKFGKFSKLGMVHRPC